MNAKEALQSRMVSSFYCKFWAHQIQRTNEKLSINPATNHRHVFWGRIGRKICTDEFGKLRRWGRSAFEHNFFWFCQSIAMLLPTSKMKVLMVLATTMVSTRYPFINYSASERQVQYVPTCTWASDLDFQNTFEHVSNAPIGMVLALPCEIIFFFLRFHEN